MPGLLVASILSTVQFIIPEILFVRDDAKSAQVHVVIVEKPKPMCTRSIKAQRVQGHRGFVDVFGFPVENFTQMCGIPLTGILFGDKINHMVKLNSQNEESTRLRILAAARQEFIENGLRGARMQEIADRAGINKALLHYHFRDKENLYQAAVRSVIDGVVAQMQPVFLEDSVSKSAADMVHAMVRAYMAVLRENPDLVGMAMRELSDGGRHLDALMEGITPLVQQIAAGFFLRMQERVMMDPSMRFPPVPIPHLMINMMSMIWGTFMLQPLYQRILPVAGFSVRMDDAFYELRIASISRMVSETMGFGGQT